MVILFLLFINCFSSFAIGSDQRHLTMNISDDQIQRVTHRLEKELYRNVVQNLIITCIDVFVYDPINRTYLLVKRNQKPAQGMWWIPGGRHCKGESFFEAAIRKCKEELSIAIMPITLLNNYSTVFPDSEWDCQTHTINQVVFALIQPSSSPATDPNHDTWRWFDIDESPVRSSYFANFNIEEYQYMQNMYDEARVFIGWAAL
jgi:GDP-mannose mannosyl hydrolase